MVLVISDLVPGVFWRWRVYSVVSRVLQIALASTPSVGTMLRRRRSCRKRQLRLKLLVRDAEGTIHEASVLQHIRR
jgi:hypothetical protein